MYVCMYMFLFSMRRFVTSVNTQSIQKYEYMFSYLTEMCVEQRARSRGTRWSTLLILGNLKNNILIQIQFYREC